MIFKITHTQEASLYPLTLSSSAAINNVRNTSLKVTGIAKGVKFFVTILLSLSSLFLQAQTDKVLKISTLSELSIEELMNVKVVTATGTEQKITEAPSAMLVITSQQIIERMIHYNQHTACLQCKKKTLL